MEHVDSWTKNLHYRTRHLWNSTTELILTYIPIKSSLAPTSRSQMVISIWSSVSSCQYKSNPSLHFGLRVHGITLDFCLSLPKARRSLKMELTLWRQKFDRYYHYGNDRYYHYGNTGCQVFKRGLQIGKDFCLKINKPKGNYWILRIVVMGRCHKVPWFDFQRQLSMSKIIGIFLILFIEEYQFRSTFFDLDILW